MATERPSAPGGPVDAAPGAAGIAAGTDPDRARVRAPGLRGRAARGSIINGLYLLFLELLRLVRGFVVAGLIAVAEFGTYGILASFHGVLIRIKQMGIGDKFIQQEAADQERAFQEALTMEMAVNVVLAVLIAALGPVLAAIFGDPRFVPLSLVLATVPIAMGFQASLWIFYRRMDFLRQRLLQSFDPVVALLVAVVLAVAGMGVWSIILGIVAGVWVTALVSVIACPYRLRPRFSRTTARSYYEFSWPLLVATATPIVIAPTTTLVGFEVAGAAGIGAITLATSLVQYTNRADQIITGTMYPAICAIQDRPRILLEAFTKSNRIVLIWALPVGAGLVLFSPSLIPDLLGERWSDAVPLVQAFGGAAALNQVAYNWTAFYRARAETKPIMVHSLAGLAMHLSVVLPLLAIFGLDGLAVGIAISTIVLLAVRLAYARRLFPAARLLSIAGRALAATASAVLSALAVRHGLGVEAITLQAGAFLSVLVIAAVVLERGLLHEAASYFRRQAASPAVGG